MMQKKTTLNKFILVPKSTVSIATFSLFILLLSTNSNAACPREDVTYYLKQGFNHEQIVKLCSSKAPEQHLYSATKNVPPKTQPPQNGQPQYMDRAPVYHHEASGIYGNPDAVFLATAVEAYDVEVTEEAIMFTRKDCFNFGTEDLNGFQDRACPNVKYSITRGGLKVVERDNGVFGIGSTALYISGKIKAEILDLEQFKTKHHKEIRAAIQNNTEKLKIDVRSGMPQSKVEAVLLRLAG